MNFNKTYESVNFTKDLDNMLYSHCRFINCSFIRISMIHVDFNNCTFIDSEFANVKTSRAKFKDSILDDVR